MQNLSRKRALTGGWGGATRAIYSRTKLRNFNGAHFTENSSPPLGAHRRALGIIGIGGHEDRPFGPARIYKAGVSKWRRERGARESSLRMADPTLTLRKAARARLKATAHPSSATRDSGPCVGRHSASFRVKAAHCSPFAAIERANSLTWLKHDWVHLTVPRWSTGDLRVELPINRSNLLWITFDEFTRS